MGWVISLMRDVTTVASDQDQDVEPFEVRMQRGGSAAIREAGRFFMQQGRIYEALGRIAERLKQQETPYAVVGGMAVVAHGYARTTVDVDVLVTSEGLESIHEKLLGLGYRPFFPGGRHLRDTESGVRIEFLVTGEYPGDGKPKPVAFPDPAVCAVEHDGVRYLKLSNLIELKLASGMTNPARLKDLADVQELVRTLDLGQDFAEQLHPWVREKFEELRRAVEDNPADPAGSP